MSMIMEVLRPDSTEPIRKMTIAAWKKTFLPYMSPSLPHSGVETVVASRYEVMTQAMCEPPLRSPTIVGSAVDTIVWSSAASIMPHMSAPMISRIWRRPSPGRAPLPRLAASGSGEPPAGAGVAEAISACPSCLSLLPLLSCLSDG